MSNQRKALKSLAKTPHTLFDLDEESADFPVGEPLNNSPPPRPATTKHRKKTKNANKDGTDSNAAQQCTYCTAYHTHWIQCSSPSCKHKWYGLDCVGMPEIPKGKWFCGFCGPRAVFPNLPGAPKASSAEIQQPRRGGRQKNPDRTKQGSKWFADLPNEALEERARKVEGQWEARVLGTWTRTRSRVDVGMRTRRSRRGKEVEVQKPASPVEQDVVHSSEADMREYDDEDVDEDSLALEPGEVLSDQGRLRLYKPIVDPVEDGDIRDSEVTVSDDEDSYREYREGTFEGFSDEEMADDTFPDSDIASHVNEDKESGSPISHDQSSGPTEEEFQSANEFWPGENEMADEIESGLDEMSVVDEEEEWEDVGSDDSGSVGAGAVGAESDSVEDRNGEEGGDFMGVGPKDYGYLDLERYGPYVVRRT